MADVSYNDLIQKLRTDGWSSPDIMKIMGILSRYIPYYHEQIAQGQFPSTYELKLSLIQNLGYTNEQADQIMMRFDEWINTYKEPISKAVITAKKARDGPTFVDLLFTDPIIQLSIGAALGAAAIALYPEALKVAIAAAGKIAEGFTPGRITDVGNVT